MKGIEKFIMVSLIVISIFGSGISSASAATVNVDAGLNNAQIQTLLDNANSGDTIQFLGSEYDNIALVINKTLNLVGANTGTLIKAISNSSYIPTIVSNNAIANTAAFYFLNTTNGSVTSSADNSTISGFNITSMANSTTGIGYKNSLIYSQNATGIQIFNNSLNFASWGIYSYICPNIQIFNNTINNMTTTGILSFGSDKALIANNTVLNSANHGIDVRHGLGQNVTVTGNTVNGANEGIYLMHSAGHNVYNNTILNCKLSSITVYGAEDINIYNNTMKNSFVGILLASAFGNVTIQNNNYSLTQTSFPPTFPYYILIADSSTNSKTVNGTFSDSDYQHSNIALESAYSNSNITNGKSTTYVLKLSNSGNSTATNLTINNLLPSGNYTNCVLNALSSGIFNSTTGTWTLDSLNANSNALIVFTVTAKKAGTINNTPYVNYTDNNGPNSVKASNNSLNINKDIKTSFASTINTNKVKKGGNFYFTIALKNSGLDTSNLITVQPKLSSAFTVVKTVNSTFKYSNGKWTGTLGSNKSVVLKMVVKMNKKGNYQLPITVDGQTKKTYNVTGT